MFEKVTALLPKESCLPGRDESIHLDGVHAVNGRSYCSPFPAETKSIVLGMGCFWGAERLFWQLSGTYVTAVGYAGGHTLNPTYQEVCSGSTNHTEVVLVVYEPEKISLDDLLMTFWREHDPTQGMRQGNDRGTQYRSAIFAESEAELALIQASRNQYQARLTDAGCGEISTEIGAGKTFYYAEEYHQQYLHKVPNGYCGLAGTGVA